MKIQYLTKMAFLDETGTLNRPEDRFFALGMIKTSRPEALYNPIQRIRDRTGFYDEIKWKNLSRKNLPVVSLILKIFAQDRESRFAAVLLDKSQLDFETYFANNFWRVYESFTSLLIRGNLGKRENLVLLADYYPSPQDSRFEQNIKRRVNRQLNRKALLIVCRLNSRATDLLQLTDLLLGAVAYELKLKNRLMPKPSPVKREFLRLMKEVFQVEEFCPRVRTRKLNVLLFSGNKKASDHGSSDQHLRQEKFNKNRP